MAEKGKALAIVSDRIKVGLCGFTVSAAAYSKRFAVLEVQQTFYQPPSLTTLAKWRQTMPPGFEFTIKAWQLITHTFNNSTYRRLKRPLTEAERYEAGAFQDSDIVNEAWARSLECAQQLQATAILFQCPASFRPTTANVNNMRGFFAKIQRPAGMSLMWEPRGTWPQDLLRQLCEELGLVHAVDPFVNLPVTGPGAYYRLHGITCARHVYSDDELARLVGLLPEAGETYVMFNNMPRVEDSRRFESMLAQRELGERLVPPLISS